MRSMINVIYGVSFEIFICTTFGKQRSYISFARKKHLVKSKKSLNKHYRETLLSSIRIIQKWLAEFRYGRTSTKMIKNCRRFGMSNCVFHTRKLRKIAEGPSGRIYDFYEGEHFEFFTFL